MSNEQIERSIVGELVLQLTSDGFRVIFSDQDGGGLYLYAVPDNGECRPADGYDYWIRLVPGNGTDIIVDYSVNLEDALQTVFELVELLEKLG
jgi:hypothetical protein